VKTYKWKRKKIRFVAERKIKQEKRDEAFKKFFIPFVILSSLKV